MSQQNAVSVRAPNSGDMTRLGDDPHVACATEQVRRAGGHPKLAVAAFFEPDTHTASYVVYDTQTRHAAVIDGVLDFDATSGRISTVSADEVIAHVRRLGLTVDWLFETHTHADHLSAAAYLQRHLGGRLAVGCGIVSVQATFASILNLRDGFVADGSQFDRLLEDGERFSIGAIPATVLHVPGHTPADVAVVIGDAVFVGDTLFMPDCGTARADFPGGDARQLYRSIRRILSLPDETRMFVCHDYKAPGRSEYAWETTVGVQKATNIHVRERLSEDDFVALRKQRDATLRAPNLLFLAIQLNIRGGRPPEPEDNGSRYFKLPLSGW